MPYITLTQLEARIPARFLTEALDDDGDGVRDVEVVAEVLAAGSGGVDSILGQRFAVPITPAPRLVVEAAIVFACELCYQRRGVDSDTNPWTEQASQWRKKLDAIAKGNEPLTPDVQRARPSVSIISSPARTHSQHINL